MDLVERYIYAVTRRLPAGQREDIERELRGLIEDMLMERSGGSKPEKNHIEAVLLELGDPAVMAGRYRESKRYLIGPDHIDLYLFVIKIVAAAVAFGLTLALALGYTVNPPESLIGALGHYIGTLFAGIMQSFAWVTAIFALVEHFGVNVGRVSVNNKWSPADLPPIPVKTALIKPVDPILGIVFTVFLVIIFNLANRLIGAYIVGEESAVTVIPLFNQAIFSRFLPFFNVLFALGIVKECLKLVIGKWTIGLAAVNAFVNAASMAIIAFAFSNQAIWNDDFMLYFARIGILPADLDISLIWSQLSKGLIVVVALALLIDTVVSLIKAIKNQAAGSI